MDEKAAEAEVVKKKNTASRALAANGTIALTAAQLKREITREEESRQVLDEYIKRNMKEGKDYGAVSVVTKYGKEVETKPSLFKPGAEKFCLLFKLRPEFSRDDDTWEMLGKKPGLICYKCTLISSRGDVIGEGRGSAKADLNGKDFDINKQIKIAQKRAQVDAVLRVGALSDFFTQDMEDAPKTSQTQPEAPKKAVVDTTARDRIALMRKGAQVIRDKWHGEIEDSDIKAVMLAVLIKDELNDASKEDLEKMVSELEQITPDGLEILVPTARQLEENKEAANASSSN